MRLIDADALRKRLREFRNETPHAPTRTYICNMLLAIIGDENQTPTIEAEPVRHGEWVDRYGGKYANPLYECSECKGTAFYKYEVDVLGKGHFVQALSAACPHCRAKMDGDSHG